MHHVLYRSCAVRPFFESQLLDLLEQSRTRNEQRNLMGLLCYSHDGHLVQVLEGEAPAVHEAFARILRDGRHQQATVLSDAAGPYVWRPAYGLRSGRTGRISLADWLPGGAPPVPRAIARAHRRPALGGLTDGLWRGVNREGMVAQD